MKLSKSQWSSLKSFIRGKSAREVGAGLRLAISNLDPKRRAADLSSLGLENLQRLRDLLPSGRMAHIHSPILHKIRQKVKTTIDGLRRPHMDPDNWPKAFRMMMKLNNSRAGIYRGPMGQWLRNNPKGLAVELSGRHVWDRRNAGDLVIMGRWSDIAAAVGDGGSRLKFVSDFGDLYDGDVNAQFDEMYGSMPGDDPTWDERKNDMFLWVSVDAGAVWTPTEDEGEVVLNAPREVIELIAGRLGGVLGGTIQHPSVITSGISAGVDTVGTLGPPLVDGISALRGMTREINPDKVLYTITIGMGPVGENSVSTDSMEVSGEEMLQAALSIRGD